MNNFRTGSRLLTVLLLLLLAACGNGTSAIPLGVPGQPTLVFIYTAG